VTAASRITRHGYDAVMWWALPAPRDVFPPPLPPGRPGDAGLFGPGSAAWRIARERLLLAGGPAALLLQVAHPLVAAGVAAHSGFVEDPLRRLRATMGGVLTVSFGDGAQVRDAVAAVDRRHHLVQGTLDAGSGGFAAGTPYRADDPELALWVFATLIWTAVNVVEQLLEPLTAAERNAYYRDMREFGRLFGAPLQAMPDDYAALDDYVDVMAREVLVVDARALGLADQILTPQPPLLPAPLRPTPALMAAGLLPDPVRTAYRLPWSRREQRTFWAVRAVSRRTVPALPPVVRFWPHYRTAVDRIAAGASSRSPAEEQEVG